MEAEQKTKQFLKRTDGCCGVWLRPDQWSIVLLALHFAVEEDLRSIIKEQIENIYDEDMSNITGSH